jgi:hypothetical protein
VLRLGLWATVGPLVLGVPPVAPAVAGHDAVVVNEFAAGRYVELRNVSMSTVDIGGFKLYLCDRYGVTGEVRIALDAQLPGGDFYLVAAPTFTGDAADQVYSGVLPRGGAALHDPDLGWVDGTAVVAGSPCGEGDPAPDCRSGSVARDADSVDTGRNAADFTCRPLSPRAPN